MVVENFTPVSALVGGILTGVATLLLLAANGRMARISGIAGGLLNPRPGEIAWRGLFLAGITAGITVTVHETLKLSPQLSALSP